jgi:hypothetical protein
MRDMTSSPEYTRAVDDLEAAGRAFARGRAERLLKGSLLLALTGWIPLVAAVAVGAPQAGVAAAAVIVGLAAGLAVRGRAALTRSQTMGWRQARIAGLQAAGGIGGVPLVISTAPDVLAPEREKYLARLTPAQRDTACQLEKEGYDGTLGQLAATAAALLK